MEGASSWGPEMVFAIVTPIGTPDTRFRNELEGGLHAYGYTTEWIKLSQLLKDQAQKHGKLVRSSPEHLRASDLMDVGDFLCEEARSAAAVALHGVNEIRKRRAEYKSPDRPDFTGPVLAIPRRAWILDSVKRPAEVKHLRRIYGDHLIVIGIQAGPTTRTNRINELIEPHAVSMGEAELHDIVSRLVSRDLDEAGKGVFGQNILKTFPMADVFIDVDGDVGHQVGRLLDLLFGNPDYPVPTDDEYGMHLAFVASTRSPELGLKVGAAIMRGSTVVSLGVNAHPTSGTDSPAYDRSAVDIRKLVLDTLRQLSTSELNEQAIQRLNEDADEYVRYLLQGPLAGAGINQLTEFQLTVHAEMAALLDAVQHGKSIDNATVYVTAYPCQTAPSTSCGSTFQSDTSSPTQRAAPKPCMGRTSRTRSSRSPVSPHAATTCCSPPRKTARAQKASASPGPTMRRSKPIPTWTPCLIIQVSRSARSSLSPSSHPLMSRPQIVRWHSGRASLCRWSCVRQDTTSSCPRG